MRKSLYLLPIGFGVLFVLLSSIFVVDEREKALVLQFGQIKAVKEDPGLAFKLPFIQQVVRYDDRILSRDVDPIEVTPLDDRRLVVDAFARYRITNIPLFRQAVGDGGIDLADSRLDNILRAELREVLGSVSSNDILSKDRALLMQRITIAAEAEARTLGLKVIDVRLKATDLPRANLAATFDRMRAEREREATDERARGREAATRITANADRTVDELVSEALSQAETIKGEADAAKEAILAEAFGRNPEFFKLTQNLNLLRNTMLEGNTAVVMSPDDYEVLQYFKSSQQPSSE